MNYTIADGQVLVETETERVSFSFPARGGVRIRQGGAEAPWCPILEGEVKTLPCAAQTDAEDTLTLAAGETAVRVTAQGGMTVLAAGRVVWTAPAGAFSRAEGWYRLRFDCAPQERIFGLGQDPMAHLDQQGRERRMWNQWGGHERSGNCGVGFFASDGGYGMLLATPDAALFHFGAAAEPVLDPLGEAMVPSPFPVDAGEKRGGEIVSAALLDVFVLPGSPVETLGQYHALTGLPQLPPKWAFGYLQCKNRYMNQADLLATARRMRDKQIPCDGLIIDWLWFRAFGDLTWDRADWPEAEKMLAELDALGFHVSSAQHPFIAKECEAYAEYASRGFLNRVPETKRITYDHTNPAARDYWWSKVEKLYRQGIRGYWTDMGELEEHFEGTKSLAGGRSRTHNAYSLLWSQGLCENQRRTFGTRPFILARSGCAGAQRFGAAIWSGDVNATWQVLRDQVVLGQGMAMSGMPWWCTDIGGFLSGAECTPELMIRWMEWGVFCALFRTHGTRPGNEPWSFGAAAEKTLTGLIHLRYRLLPALYSLAVRCALTGLPMIRPMAVAFPADAEAAACTGQLLVGETLLVAPVTEPGQRRKRVYLPQGRWVHWWTGESLESGWQEVAAPLGEVPLFVRAGAVLPVFGRVGRNMADCGDLTLLTFPGEGGSFDYYDEEGLTFAYQQGALTHARLVNHAGCVAVETLAGEMAPWRAEPFVPPARGMAAVDASWAGHEAVVTLTLLRDTAGEVCVSPEPGWEIASCSLEEQMREIYTPCTQARWQGRVKGRAGDAVTWRLLNAERRIPVRAHQAALTLRAEGGGETSLTAVWDQPALSDPWLLGCMPVGALSIEQVLESARAETPSCGAWRWRRDPQGAHNPFGYVDFRRLSPQQEGERMLGEAYAMVNLYAEQEGTVAHFSLRHDSPIALWLNDCPLMHSDARNAADIPVTLPLRPGRNVLVIRQRADVARPYSGGEFGFCLMCLNNAEIACEN